MKKLLTLLACSCAFGIFLDAQTTLTSSKPLVYPLTAKAAGIDGQVTLSATITKEGKVANVKVLTGPPQLQQSALDSVQSWVFKPYSHSGKPIALYSTFTIDFSLCKDKEFSKCKGKERADAQAKAQEELAKSSRLNQPQDSSSKQ